MNVYLKIANLYFEEDGDPLVEFLNFIDFFTDKFKKQILIYCEENGLEIDFNIDIVEKDECIGCSYSISTEYKQYERNIDINIEEIEELTDKLASIEQEAIKEISEFIEGKIEKDDDLISLF